MKEMMEVWRPQRKEGEKSPQSANTGSKRRTRWMRQSGEKMNLEQNVDGRMEIGFY